MNVVLFLVLNKAKTDNNFLKCKTQRNSGFF